MVLRQCQIDVGKQRRAEVLEAFKEWLRTSTALVRTPEMASQPLVQAALEGLQDPETFDASVDTVVELIYATSAKGSPSPDVLPLVQVLVGAVSPPISLALLHELHGPKEALAQSAKLC